MDENEIALIKGMVNDVVLGNFVLDPIKYPKKNITSRLVRKNEKAFVDSVSPPKGYTPQEIEVGMNEDDITKPLKSVATDFVVNEFFETPDTLHRFMTRIIDTFNIALQIYRERRGFDENQAFLLYKGGNILRIISKEFLLSLPGVAAKKIKGYYSQFFKRGDIDFTIILDPGIENFDEIFLEISYLSYLVQDYLRDFVYGNIMRYFNFFRYNREYQNIILTEYLEKFNRAEGFEDQFKNIAIDGVMLYNDGFKYRPDPDATLRFADEDSEPWEEILRKDKRLAISAKIAETYGFLRVTHNNSLDFGNKEARSKFNLTRTKAFFSLENIKDERVNVGGELIDVSISHKNDSFIQSFYDKLDENTREYTINYGDCSLKFKSYSIKYLTKDIEKILFIQKDYPWDDAKYQKRINRLMYLYFINIFGRVNEMSNRSQILNDIDQNIFSKMDSFNKVGIVDRINEFKDRYKNRNYLDIMRLPDYLLDLTSLVAQNPDQIPEYKKLGKVFKENISFLLDTIRSITTYCKKDDAKVREGEVEEIEVGEFI